MVTKKRETETSLKDSDELYFERLHYFFIEFLSRSDKYRSWITEAAAIARDSAESDFFPINLSPRKGRRSEKPDKSGKPRIEPSFVFGDSGVWNITDKFCCAPDSAIFQVRLDKPIEGLCRQIKIEIEAAQDKFWKTMGDENFFGEYRFLVDHKRDKKGRYKGRIKKSRFAEWKDYLRVFDLRQKPWKGNRQTPFKEIAIQIFNNHDESKARQYLHRAKLLIAAAEENKFPPAP